MGQVQGKTAIVTGAGSGIGAASAETLAREGAAVLLTDIDATGGEAVAARIARAGGRARFLHQDVTDEAAWPGVIAAAEALGGRLDVMVANAGIAIMVPMLEMSLAEWRRQSAVNLDGVFLSVKYAVPAMRRAGGGSIVILSSVAGIRGSIGLAGYCATKGGVRLFAKAAAMECASAKDNVRINTVHPGIIDTPIWDKIAPDPRRNAPLDAHAMAAVGAPMGRAGAAQEIANGVVFLASDASSYMTGAELVIDGGITSGSAVRR